MPAAQLAQWMRRLSANDLSLVYSRVHVNYGSALQRGRGLGRVLGAGQRGTVASHTAPLSGFLSGLDTNTDN